MCPFFFLSCSCGARCGLPPPHAWGTFYTFGNFWVLQRVATGMWGLRHATRRSTTERIDGHFAILWGASIKVDLVEQSTFAPVGLHVLTPVLSCTFLAGTFCSWPLAGHSLVMKWLFPEQGWRKVRWWWSIDVRISNEIGCGRDSNLSVCGHSCLHTHCSFF